MEAQTPEELETMFEDALVLNDFSAVASLFAAGAVLAVNDDPPMAGGAISREAVALWGGSRPYIADPSRVLVARDVALMVGDRGVNVARRDVDGCWRFAIVWQNVEATGRRNGKGSNQWP